MARCFHLSSVRNRDSIRRYGLDPARMGGAPGLAGSQIAEVDGVFLLPDSADAGSELEWLARSINNTGGPLDLWAADNVDPESLVDNGNGYQYLPGRIPATDVVFLGQLPVQDNAIDWG